jgi:uncharacterized membrane protein YphA (DoxX/SURF4 family)
MNRSKEINRNIRLDLFSIVIYIKTRFVTHKTFGRSHIGKILTKRLFLSPWPSLALRMVIGGLFAYAGVIKILDPQAFARTISHWDLVPEPFLPCVAIGLPVLEIVGGLALLVGSRLGFCVVSGLLLFFVGILGYGMSRGLEVDCGCFGPQEIASRNSLAHAFYRDLALLAGVLFLYCIDVIRAKAACLQTNNNGIRR